MRDKRDAGGPAYYGVLVAATFLMASGFIAGKILLTQVPAFLLVGWRFVVAALAAGAIVFFNRRDLLDVRNFLTVLAPASLSARDWVTVALIGLLQTALALGLLFLAMETISASTAAILLFTNPLWVALIGQVTRSEKLSRLGMIGIISGVAGVAIALGGAFSLSPQAIGGEALGLLAALSWAGSTIINRRARLPIDHWALSFWQMMTGALALLVIAYARGERWPADLPLSGWAWFLWLAIPGSTLSFGLWFLTLARGGATRSSSYLFLAPLFTVILSAIVLHSGVTATQAAGGVLVGLGLWLVNRTPPAPKTGART